MKWNNITVSFALNAIDFYQKHFSPVISQKISCRFHPTCSEYAKQAIAKYGLASGLLKSLNRYVRCNPYNHQSCIDYP